MIFPFFNRKNKYKCVFIALSGFILNTTYNFSVGCCNCLSSSGKSGGKSDESKKNQDDIEMNDKDFLFMKKLLNTLIEMKCCALDVYESEIRTSVLLESNKNHINNANSLNMIKLIVDGCNTSPYDVTPCKNYKMFINKNNDNNMFIAFTEKNFKNAALAVFLKSQKFKINLDLAIELTRAGKEKLFEYYNSLDEDNKLLLINIFYNPSKSSTEMNIFYSLVDMDTLTINGYESTDVADLNELKNLIGQKIRSGIISFYAVGYFKDIKNHTLDNFVPKRFFYTKK